MEINQATNAIGNLAQSLLSLLSGSSSEKSYTVQQGDSLSDIASAHGTSVNAIMELNTDIIKNPDFIYPGDSLRLPSSTPKTTPPSHDNEPKLTGSLTALAATATPITAVTQAPSTTGAARLMNDNFSQPPSADGGMLYSLACAEGNINKDGSLRSLGVSKSVPDGFPAHLHQDPGDQNWNKGRLSYSPVRAGYSSVDSLTMEQCEQKAIATVKAYSPEAEQKLIASGIQRSDPNFRFYLANTLDLANQAGTGKTGCLQGKHSFFNEVAQSQREISAGKDPLTAISEARARSWTTDSGVVDFSANGERGYAPCLRDQTRRAGEVYDCLKQYGGVGALSNTPSGSTPGTPANGNGNGDVMGIAMPTTIQKGGYLNKGDSGEGVKDLQRLLIANGADIKATGMFDGATAREVEAFKADKRHPLGTAPGQPQSAVGKTTWEKLNQFASAGSPTENGKAQQQKFADWYGQPDNFKRVEAEASRIMAGVGGTACAATVSSALRTAGIVDIPHKAYANDGGDNWYQTDGLSRYLETEKSWQRSTNMADLSPGDVVFTVPGSEHPTAPSHTYVFMGWADKEKGVAKVIDNQRDEYGGQFIHERTIGGPVDGQKTKDPAAYFLRQSASAATPGIGKGESGSNAADGSYGGNKSVMDRIAAARNSMREEGPSTCTASVLYTLDDLGIASTAPGAGTTDDSNNVRGAAVQMINRGTWMPVNLPGSKPVTLSGSYGAAQIYTITAAQYKQLVGEGKIPSGAILMQTRHGNLNNNETYGNDIAFTLDKGKLIHNFDEMQPLVYGGSVEVLALMVPK
jgi:LysM domain